MELGSTNLSEFSGHLENHLKNHSETLLILDGLDEVPEANKTREHLKKEVMDFCNEFPHCRVLVTARPYAYTNDKWRLPGFEIKYLAEFSTEQIEAFIEKWYLHFAAKDPSLNKKDAERYTLQLKSAVNEIPSLAELAPRPLLLTLMVSLHRWRGGGALLEKRHELYEESVKLLLDLWQRPKTQFDNKGKPIKSEYDVFQELGISQEKLRKALERVAYEVHRDQKDLKGVANIRAGILADAIYEASNQKDRNHHRRCHSLRNGTGRFTH